MNAYINSISYYLPPTVLTNSQIAAQFPEWDAEKIAKKIGIQERHISSEDEFASDMAVKAATKLFDEHNIDKGVIDFILLCTQSPDYFLPTTACIVQDRLKISTNVGAVDFNQGCSGYIYGLALAKGLIISGIAKNVLLITSETYSKYIHSLDKGNRTIFGDAASATLISTQGEARIGEFVLGSDGKGAENLIVKVGGSRYPQKKEISKIDDFGNVINDEKLYMNGAAIFNFTLESIPSLVEDTLKKNNLSMDDIQKYVFHQANEYMLNHLRKKIGIPIGKFPVYMKNSGNTVSSTIPITLKSLFKNPQSTPIPNDKYLLAGFGVGYSWGGVVIYF